MAREIVHPRNYRALAAAFRLTSDPLRNVWRCLTASGSYPYTPAVRSPTGIVSPALDSFHDMMTFNEIFLREGAGPGHMATAQAITCKDINAFLRTVLDTEPAIDLLKIDIEGLELAVVEAIDREHLPRIQTICFEWGEPGLVPLAEFFDATFFNETYRLTLRH